MADTRRHGSIPLEGAGKGCCRRKGEDDQAYRDNLEKALVNSEEATDTSGFVMRVNGKVIN